jgi:hypothetical protein
VQKLSVALLCALIITACKEGTGPSQASYSIAVLSGDGQFGTRSSRLLDPLQVVVTDPVSKDPVSDVQVQWRMLSGAGTLSAVTSTTDSKGVASTQLTLGTELGNYQVEATTTRLVGSSVKFTARAVDPPAISSIAPTSANAGDTVTVNGTNFSPTAEENIVLFGGFRGKVTSATTTRLRVVVPLCVPSRSINVQSLLGAVSSNSVPLTVNGTTASALQLARGQVRVFTDPNELACFRLPGGITGMTLLFVPQNYSQVVGSFTAFELTGLTGGSTAFELDRAGTALHADSDPQTTFELRIRQKERALLKANPNAGSGPNLSTVACSAVAVGDRCSFQVIDKNDKFQTISAEVKFVSAHALFMQDVSAPANGLTATDFAGMAALFDDPIYSTDVATWGAPSDLDHNGKIIVLGTPIVNAMTDRGANGFIAGFFYGCDLLPKSACTGSNIGEVFYTMVVDVSGQFSDARTVSTVTRNLPPVFAHEFQHMINFGARGNSTDALWLSEGMAHHAEDVVGDVFAQRGDAATASQFKGQNYLRANRYLRATSGTSLISEDEMGTLELRGGAWLFVKYLAGQYGNTILKQLTSSQLSSVDNVTAQAGKSWSSLLSDWSIALWADDAPELIGVSMAKQHTFPNINLRTTVNLNGNYPLVPTIYSFADFVHRETIQASSQAYIMVQAPPGTTSKALNLTYAGQFGGAFAVNAAPQMTVLRIQ